MVTEARYCIVGAGACGLTAAKNLSQKGIAFDVFERSDVVGGLWNHDKPGGRVYSSAHLISSKTQTQYTDFPFPESYPDYPHHTQVLEYLRSYARRFDLMRHIRFNTEVVSVEPAGRGLAVRLSDGSKRNYAGILVANGHLWDPSHPEYPGQFSGQIVHSADYKSPRILRDKTVLVIGAGNSGCDIAVEAAQHAKKVFHSMRRGYHFIPKYVFGKPADEISDLFYKLRLPMRVRRAIATLCLALTSGSPERFGLPAPDHKLFETHPIVNSQMLYFLGHGDITPKPDVARFDGAAVEFADGSRESIDLVICATGYKVTIPFLSKDMLNWRNGAPDLFLNIFHPERDDIFCVGLVQANGGLYGLADRQAQLIAKYIAKKHRWPGALFKKKKRAMAHDLSAGQRYVGSGRHRLEVDIFSYMRLLERYNRLLAL